MKHEALGRDQTVLVLQGATMNNGCSSVLQERLRDVNARVAGDDDDDVKGSVLSAQQNRKAGRGRTVLCVFWDRDSQRK